MFRWLVPPLSNYGKAPRQHPVRRLLSRRRLGLELLETRRVLASFTVNASDDVDNGACDADHCSLREAIIAANETFPEDRIAFNMGGGGEQTIQLTAALPAIANPTVFDGTVQVDSTAIPIIQLEGSELFPGSIAFEGPTFYDTGWGQQFVTSADLNGDGTLDVVLGTYAEDPPAVLLGNGDGSFGEPISLGVERFYYATSGDFDKDGKTDLAVGRRDWRDNGVIERTANVYVLRGNGDGTFGEPVEYEGLGGTGVTAGDLNGDGDLDLAVANRNTDQVFVLLGNGDGTFTPSQKSYYAGIFPVSMVAGDLDGQNGLDLVVSSSEDDSLSVHLNNGDGTFADTVYLDVSVAYWGGIAGLVAGDLDNDGDVDLAVRGNGVSVLLGMGDGTFLEPDIYPVSSNTMAAGDVDADGDLDLLLVDAKEGTAMSGDVKFLVNLGDGTFAEHPVGFALGMRAWAGVVADLDGDGDSDFAVVSESCKFCFEAPYGSPTVSILLNHTITADSPDPDDVYEAGDANQDGTFDRLDILQVLQGGKYLTGEPATWQEGDWNGDEVFDQLDLAYALAAGEFL